MFVHPELVEGYLGIDSKYPAFKQRKSRAFSERAYPGDVYFSRKIPTLLNKPSLAQGAQEYVL